MSLAHPMGNPHYKTCPMRAADLPLRLSQAAPPIGTSANHPRCPLPQDCHSGLQHVLLASPQRIRLKFSLASSSAALMTCLQDLITRQYYYNKHCFWNHKGPTCPASILPTGTQTSTLMSACSLLSLVVGLFRQCVWHLSRSSVSEVILETNGPKCTCHFGTGLMALLNRYTSLLGVM